MDDRQYNANQYDIIVIGAGHAGIEAGLAGSRLGCRTAIFTINLDSVGNCPCNPSIGGTAKGHLVKEIDALGGEMGKTTDKCFIQSRMLNRGKGPAVHSLRAQIDRNEYKVIMKHILETQENLELKQAEIIDISQTNDGKWSIVTRNNIEYISKCVILATGTYLNGRIHIGEVSYKSGPDGIFPSYFLNDSLNTLNIKTKKFKTGTPARILKSSINFKKLNIQNGDEDIIPFSYKKPKIRENRAICYIGYTNLKTKDIILKNIKKSPMYNGTIQSVGPRYCPSIEDKIVRFSDKTSHQFFIEPCGLNTEEMYLQGLSTALPESVQIEMYHSIEGLENCIIMRPAYAIEYDCIDSTQLNATMEFKHLPGLYGAGQFNGSSGYEEAAAQGLIAGINAALKIKNRPPLILNRANSYIGTLIDDLITKDITEPYRMMTSRSEYRLVLRQDNADERLTPLGREIGLVTDEQWEIYKKRNNQKIKELQRVRHTTIFPSAPLNNMLVSRETSPLTNSIKLSDLLKRPRIDYESLNKFDLGRPKLDKIISEKVEIEIKYEGYIEKQKKHIHKMRKLDSTPLPKDLDYSTITGLRLEAREKLNKIRPENLGQASRIMGVSPADISILMIFLHKRTNSKN